MLFMSWRKRFYEFSFTLSWYLHLLSPREWKLRSTFTMEKRAYLQWNWSSMWNSNFWYEDIPSFFFIRFSSSKTPGPRSLALTSYSDNGSADVLWIEEVLSKFSLITKVDAPLAGTLIELEIAQDARRKSHSKRIIDLTILHFSNNTVDCKLTSSLLIVSP